MPVRSFTETELVVTERRRFERRMLMMVWLGVATISVIELNPFYLVVGSLAILVNLIAVIKDREVYLSRQSVNMAILASSVILLVEIFLAGEPPLIALSHYLILIQLCKLYEQKANRDYVQIMILNALLMVTAALQCNTFWFILALAGYIYLLCSTMMVFTIKRSLDSAADAHLNSDDPMTPQQLAWNINRKWPRKSLRRCFMLVFLVCMFVGTGFFMIAPRGEGAELNFLGQNRGFKSFIKLGELDQIYLSDRIIMKIESNPKPGDKKSAKGEMVVGKHFRGQVMYRYKDSKWSTTAAGRKRVESPEITQEIRDNSPHMNVFMVPDFLPRLFVAEDSNYVESPHGDIVQSAGCWSMEERGWLDHPARYTLYFYRPARKKGQKSPAAFRPDFTPPFDPTWLKDISIPRRVQNLAEQWCQDLLDKREKKPNSTADINLLIAQRIETKLEKEYKYSLDLSKANPDRDAVEDFLFYMNEGHCEYFASACTMLCRALDVPARMATGFFAGTGEEVNGTFLLRERDAHAWTEVYHPRLGWVIVDATPMEVRDKEPKKNGWKNFSDYWASTKFYWYEKMSGFDSKFRHIVAQWTRNSFNSVSSKLQAWTKDLWDTLLGFLTGKAYNRLLVPIAILVPLLGLTLIFLIIVQMARHFFQRENSQDFESEGISNWKRLSFTRSLFSLFTHHGYPHWPEQSLRNWATEAAIELELPVNKVRELIDLYYAIRWGNKHVSRKELRKARHDVHELEKTLKHRQPKPADVPTEEEVVESLLS